MLFSSSSALCPDTVLDAPAPHSLPPALPQLFDNKAANNAPALAILFPTTYLVGSVYPPQAVTILYPRHAPPPPDKESNRGKAVMNEVEKELQNLYLVAKLRAKQGWYETSESVCCARVVVRGCGGVVVWWYGGVVVWGCGGAEQAIRAHPIGPYERYDPQKVHNSLTAGSLRGPGKLAIPPIAFAKEDESEAIRE
jgi:hypothetical protein